MSAQETSPVISLQGVNKWFGELHVLRDIDLTIAAQERVVVCGPSGSGKSTMIRCINGLEQHQKGEIHVQGSPCTRNSQVSDRCVAGLAWCFSRSICSRI